MNDRYRAAVEELAAAITKMNGCTTDVTEAAAALRVDPAFPDDMPRRRSGYPDFIDDRAGLENWRQEGCGSGHALIANRNTVRRFIDTIDRLETLLQEAKEKARG